MNTFADAAVKSINSEKTRTINGMRSRVTSGKSVLDFFSAVGSSRGNPQITSFNKALAEDVELALRVLLWTRDVRGGAGERQQFRDLLQALEKADPINARAIMHMIPEIGRWDDLFSYQDPINRKAAFKMIAKALDDGNGLCAKWCPRKGKIASELRNFLGLTPKQYRKKIVNLSKTVETQMCAKDWDNINFSQVPSLAAARYQKAFAKNAPEKYSEYRNALTSKDPEVRKTVKINAGAVYPYDIVKSVQRGDEAVANEQWNALPNYIGDIKVLPLVDTSGSMTMEIGKNLTALDVAISLGLYTSEKNTGAFKDLFVTFSRTSKINKCTGTLSQRVSSMSRADWGMNTNLHAAFDNILDVAVNGKVASKDMPDYLLILSDMQFDYCTNFDDSALKMIKRKYKEAGYKVPKIIFWNLNANYGNDVPVKFDKNGTALVSGFSPSLMKTVLSADFENYTPMNVMLETIMVERYNYKA